jgi:hypothetical protein
VLADNDLSEPEQRIARVAQSGELIDFGVGREDKPIPSEPWDGMPTLRAEVLAELLTGARGPVRAIRVSNAHIVGALDLELATLVCPLVLSCCHFDEPINLRETRATSIRLIACHAPSVRADQLRTSGGLEFSFSAIGKVILHGAQVSGYLMFAGATLNNPDGTALDASALTVDLAMICRGLTAHGEVNLTGAHMATLSLSAARLSNPGGVALNTAGLRAGQDMMCRDGFVAEGEVNMLGARIGACLHLGGASLSNPHSRALRADRLVVGENLVCDEGFAAEGEVRLSAAQVSGQLDFSGATLTNPDGNALTAEGLVVDQDMFCNNLVAQGKVSLCGARIGWQLAFHEATLNNPGGWALDLEDAQVTSLVLLPAAPPEGVVDLTNAQVRRLHDSVLTWPDDLRLRGFTYDSLENDPEKDSICAAYRLYWLNRYREGYDSGLFDQLAAAYRRSGRMAVVRQVMIDKNQRRREVMNPMGKAWNWLMYITVGYGYRPWLAGLWLLALLAVGTVMFVFAYPAYLHPASPSPPAFQPVAYTFDLLVPAFDLGEQRSWYPQGAAQWCAWSLTGAGWVLTVAVVAGAPNMFRRE